MPGEIIVVDGGSADATRGTAASAGARVITTQRGRGAQLAAGVAGTRLKWLLLLHADTRLGSGWQDVVRGQMASGPHRAGYFRFHLASSDRRARHLERAVAARCRLFALPYGDQGLLIHRDLLNTIGGIRPLALMEDVDLVRRLGRRRLVALDAPAITSPARWERDGWYRRSFRNMIYLLLYLAGVPTSYIQRLYE